MNNRLAETDITRWHLDSSSRGQVAWTYDNSTEREMGEQSFETKYWLSIHPVCSFSSPACHFVIARCKGLLNQDLIIMFPV
jgi:hypothetical protein